MKQTILLFLLCFTFSQVPAQVRAQGVPAERKSEAKADNTDPTLLVFPNPSSGVVTISLAGYEGVKTDLLIMNVIGNIVYKEVVQDASPQFSKTLDLSKLSKGLYYVKIETPSYSEVRKVILR